jgi:ATP-dependent Clp protease ATP-binding subunit ClpA
MHTALGTSVAPCDNEPTAPRLQALQFTDDAMAALRVTHAATLRLGHNYVGTEHLLLGILSTDSPTASTLTTLGLDANLVERAINEEVARIQAERPLEQSETSQ